MMDSSACMPTYISAEMLKTQKFLFVSVFSLYFSFLFHMNNNQ